MRENGPPHRAIQQAWPLQSLEAMRSLLLAAVMSLSLPAIAFADGKATYTKMCVSCHGADGKGNPTKAGILKLDPAVLNLGRPESASATRDQLKEMIIKGKGKMPAYEKKLTAEEVDPVLDYAMQLAAAIRGAK